MRFTQKWKADLIDGGRGINARALLGHVVRYMLEKHGSKCSLCSWSQINPRTGKVPLEIDHIDGNSDNNSCGNLRVICPNCHALTPNFRGLNIGHGREWRRLKYLKVNQ